MSDTTNSSHLDVLIIGAGPTALMAALWMSQLGIKTRIVDKKGSSVPNGHADGLQIRSVEIFDSFGFAKRFSQNAATTIEINSWALNDKEELHRSDRTLFSSTGDLRFWARTFHQGDIERLLLDAILDRSDIKVERATLPTSLKFDKSQAEDPDAYPITVELRHLEDDEIEHHVINSHIVTKEGIKPQNGRFKSILGRASMDDSAYGTKGPGGVTETVHAKYLLGCDGAHSWTRRQLGVEMEGENNDMAWGVMDIIPISNFPDIHLFATIQSKSGAFIAIPRENNMIRIYVQLGEVKRDAKAPFTITAAAILAKAQQIFAPAFFLRYAYCDWWTVYQVGQRVASRYAEGERIFLAGDAVHTHTPKGGQGMNVSMQDAYNLGWKLGGVLTGQLPRAILKTYEAERRPIAQRLIAWDKQLSRVYDALGEEVVHQTYVRNLQFLSGVGITYPPSVLVGYGLVLQDDGTMTNGAEANGTGPSLVAKRHLASNVPLGMRLPNHKVLRHGDASPFESQELLQSDGRWRLMVFGGDALHKAQMDRLNVLGGNLAAPDGILNRQKIELADFPSAFFPFDEEQGYDHRRIFADAEGQAHAFYGVDVARGCMVAIRPDQHVGYIGELEDVGDVTKYFDGILNRR